MRAAVIILFTYCSAATTFLLASTAMAENLLPSREIREEAPRELLELELTRSDLQAQWLAAKSAEQMVTLSWVQLALTVLTFGAALYSVRISRETLISENRPILVSQTPSFPQGIALNSEPIPFDLKFSNNGRGAGFVRGYSIGWASNENTIKALKAIAPTKAHWPLAVNHNWGFDSGQGSSIDLPLGQRLQIQNGNEKLLVFAHVDYSGGGRKRYIARSAYEWVPSTKRFIPIVDDDWWQ